MSAPDPATRYLRREVEALFTPSRSASTPGMVGAEVELIPVTRHPERLPVPLSDSSSGGHSVLGFLASWGSELGILNLVGDSKAPWFSARSGGRITFEPGGQVEYSTAPHDSAAGAQTDLIGMLGPLRRAALETDMDLVSVGLNPWHGLTQIPLQVPLARYRAMDAYFARVGPHGQRMMRLSAAMQVNVDLGDPEIAPARWRAANLLSPVLRSVFANSPADIAGTRVPGGRSVTWDMADPGRTGVTELITQAADTPPVESYLKYALRTPVMMLPERDGGLRVAPEGLRFDDWRKGERGSRQAGEAWDVHLGTLFPDVRPRGWLEIRTIDVPAEEWWGVPLLLLPALLYDADALKELLRALEALEPRLPDLARSAPRSGLADEVLARIAEQVFDIALDSARGFAGGFFSADMLSATEEFRRRYVTRRTTQAEEEGAPRAVL